LRVIWRKQIKKHGRGDGRIKIDTNLKRKKQTKMHGGGNGRTTTMVLVTKYGGDGFD